LAVTKDVRSVRWVTEEQIYRELCRLDPALEAWHKCEHEVEQTDDPRKIVYAWKCKSCGSIMRETLAFGDGDTSRYSTVDVLLGLCERLGIEVVRPAVCVFRGASDCRCEVEGSLASGKRGEGYAKGKQGEVARVAVRAFSEAILRAFGRWSE
jgi:hypothetical protein